jgi:hypothetical protein
MVDTTIATIISAIVAFVIPKLLDPVFKKGGSSSKFHWGMWIIAHAAAGALGGALSAGLGLSGLNTPGGMGNWAVFGACLGITQWLVLQRYIRIRPMWAVWTTIGWATFSLFQILQLPGFIGWTIVGLIIGVLQWFTLRKVGKNTGWWIPANIIAWVGAFHIALPITLAAGFPPGLDWIFGWSLLAVIASVITGIAMSRVSASD